MRERPGTFSGPSAPRYRRLVGVSTSRLGTATARRRHGSSISAPLDVTACRRHDSTGSRLDDVTTRRGHASTTSNSVDVLARRNRIARGCSRSIVESTRGQRRRIGSTAEASTVSSDPDERSYDPPPSAARLASVTVLVSPPGPMPVMTHRSLRERDDRPDPWFRPASPSPSGVCRRTRLSRASARRHAR